MTLGMTCMYDSASALTSELKAGRTKEALRLFRDLEELYRITIKEIDMVG